MMLKEAHDQGVQASLPCDPVFFILCFSKYIHMIFFHVDIRKNQYRKKSFRHQKQVGTIISSIVPIFSLGYYFDNFRLR